jgi:hypothetical protein
LALPACAALTVQVPALTRVKVLALTMHTLGVVDANDTAKPELAVAMSAVGAEPRFWLPGETKETVCVPGSTVNELETDVAAKNEALPLCVATTVQVPTPVSVALAAFTVQTLGVTEAKATVSPELAVATKSTATGPKTGLPGTAKLMLCAAGGGAGSVLPPPPQALNKASENKLSEAEKNDVNRRFIAWVSEGVADEADSVSIPPSRCGGRLPRAKKSTDESLKWKL